MKRRNQMVAAILSIAMMLSLAACGNGAGSSGTVPGTSGSVVTPGTSGSVVDPGTSGSVVTPGASGSVVDPVEPADPADPADEPVNPTVTGEELRDSVVSRVMDIMNVDYTLQNRISWSNLTDEKTAAFPEAGILPNTYFNYTRFNYPLKGVMVETTPATFEQFLATVDMSESVVPGIGHVLTPATEFIGMDMNTFLTDISGRVLVEPLTGVKAALTSPDLTALYTGANFDAASSMEAVASADEVKAAYAKLQKGDLLLSWNNNAKIKLVGMETDADMATLDPKIHVLVVKDVDPAAGTVTVMYNMYAKTLYYFQCDTCGLVETEGPTSAVIPIHWDDSNKTLKRHKQTNRDTECKGTWTTMYGTTWRTETVTYDQLFGQGELNVPFGSTGYLPYTFKDYATGLDIADVQITVNDTSDVASTGLTASIVSDYPITAVRAVLTPKGGERMEFFKYPDLDKTGLLFDHYNLNAVLKESAAGTEYNVKFYVRSGPLGAQTMAAGEYRLCSSVDFVIAAAPAPADPSTMTDDEVLMARRDAAEAYMRQMATVLWRSDVDANYSLDSGKSPEEASTVLPIVAGRLYRGIPYAYQYSNLDGFLSFAGEKDGGVYTVSGLEFMTGPGAGRYGFRLGNDCSSALVTSWNSVGATLGAAATKNMTLNNGFLPVGEYVSDPNTNENSSDTTNVVNGPQVMYKAYSQLQKADGIVKNGHCRMVVEVHTEYKSDGTIDAFKSYVICLEQTKNRVNKEIKHHDPVLDEDVYEVYGVDVQYRFNQLCTDGYLPITCEAFLNPAAFAEAEVKDSLSDYNATTILDGTLTANRFIATVTVTITDSEGKEVQQATLLPDRYTATEFAMGDFVTHVGKGVQGSIDPSTLKAGNYHCTTVCKLLSGESVTVRDFDFTV